MPAVGHRPDDPGELLEVSTFRGHKRNTLEEWNDLVEECPALSNDVDQRSVSFAVGLDVAAPEAIADTSRT
jgi:hypothetical protein